MLVWFCVSIWFPWQLECRHLHKIPIFDHSQCIVVETRVRKNKFDFRNIKKGKVSLMKKMLKMFHLPGNHGNQSVKKSIKLKYM